MGNNMDNFKVYMHIFPNKKIYIGITMQKPEKRWRNGYGYKENKRMTNAIKKYGWANVKHILVYENLSKEQAEEKEIQLIKLYKANQQEYGYNIENGGCHNGKTSIETRKKQSIIAKGKHRSPRTEFKKGNKLGIPCSQGLKEKLSKERKGKHISINTEFKKGHKPLNNRKVRYIETNKIYNSVKEAGIDTNSNIAHISNVCKGKRKTTNNLHWEYVN